MVRLLSLLRDHFSRILGGLLLCAAFVTLLMAPPKPAFSIANCLLFFTFVLTGALLLWGLWGPDPIAVSLRREARQAGPAVRTIGRAVPERVFRYCPTFSWGRTLSVGLTTLLGLCIMGLGLFFACGLPGPWPQRIAMGLPLWIGGGLSLWCPLRQLTMYVQIDADGLESRGYFRTVRLRWEDVVALIVRSYYLRAIAGSAPVGTVYSVYAQRTRQSFLAKLPKAAELAALISDATGLPWQ